MMRPLPGYLAALVVALLLFVFIAYPLGTVLTESFVVSGPMSVFELRQMTHEALDRLDPEERDRSVARWVKSAKPRQRMEAVAAALELIGEEVSWDRKAAFDAQIAAADEAVAALDPDRRARLEAELPFAIVRSSTGCAPAPTRGWGSITTSASSASRGSKGRRGTASCCRPSPAC
jgi:iron(III) transport system permease protein